MRTAAFLLALLLALPAQAGSRGKVSERDCKKLLKNAQVGAEYQPGVDVRGRRVKEADLGGGSKIKVPKEISFNIGVDIAEKYGLDGKNISAEGTIGKVTVRGDKVYWNGERLGGDEVNAVTNACRRIYGRH